VTEDHLVELQMERGTNEQYMRRLNQGNAAAQGSVVANTALPRNSQFHGTVAGGPKKGPPAKPLIGRIALDHEDSDLGESFYIGSGRLDVDGIQVIEWAAPMAQLFYKGPEANVDIADNLAARRTFTPRLDDIVDFEDAVEPGIAGAPFAAGASTTSKVGPPPAAAKRPTVAAPPTPPKRPTAHAVSSPPPPPSPPNPSSPAPKDDQHAESARTTATASAVLQPQVAPQQKSDHQAPAEKTSDATSMSDPLPERIQQLRAPKTVFSALTAPRTGQLSSLLRTLQPQQYDLVTWPEDEHLVVQGHPGTGKTVIGLHRAAYLTNPARLAEEQRAPKGDVLVLGPTHAYVEHVRPVLDELSIGGWAVWSLPHFYSQVGEFADPHFPTESDHISTSADPLGRVVLKALESYAGPRTTVSFVNHLFEAGDEVSAAADADEDVIRFLRAGKNHEYARGHSRYHPVMALAGLVVTGVGLANRFRHIVVDEAQDLRPIDLLILRLLVSQGVNLTLLGDMNQRRSDFTHADWDLVSKEVGIHRVDGTAPLVPIAVGYRSTNQILRYAAGLLPRAERTAEALRDGPEPSTIRSSSTGALLTDARKEGLRLQQRAGGLVAILTMAPKEMSDHLRKQKWSRGHRQHAWCPPDSKQEILILHPDSARGLEFDGVVVVEPADYPARLGRHGVLYTSLTRATKELSVVHHRALPKGLKDR
jgi:hypothetical protein